MFRLSSRRQSARQDLAPTPRSSRRFRPALESLEGRCLLASTSGSSPVTHLGLTLLGSPSDPTVSLTVRALDQSNNIAAGYQGTVHFTASGPSALLPPDYTFMPSDLGVHTFGGVRLPSSLSPIPEPASVGAMDTATPSINGTLQTGSATASGEGLAAVIGPAFVAPDTPFSIKVSYATSPPVGTTVHFISSDPQAVLPGDYMFTGQDNGSHTFSGVQLHNLGPQTINASDQFGTAIVPLRVFVGPRLAVVQGNPAGVLNGSAGQAATFRVIAMNGESVITNYTGNVHFTTTDGLATLPHDYTFKPRDQGQQTFTATFRTAAVQDLEVQDTGDAIIKGRAAALVGPGPATRFLVAAPDSVTADSAFPTKVIPIDDFNNVVTNYGGAVHFTSTDAGASLPADYGFTGGDQGVHTFEVSGLSPSQNTTIRVRATNNPDVTGKATFQVTGPIQPMAVPGAVAGPRGSTSSRFGVAPPQFVSLFGPNDPRPRPPIPGSERGVRPVAPGANRTVVFRDVVTAGTPGMVEASGLGRHGRHAGGGALDLLFGSPEWLREVV
jgi:hypothetical protein